MQVLVFSLRRYNTKGANAEPNVVKVYHESGDLCSMLATVLWRLLGLVYFADILSVGFAR